MTSPSGDWTPPEDTPVAPAEPTEEVTTGPVAEAPADPTPTAPADGEASTPASSADAPEPEPVATVSTTSNASTGIPEQSARTAAAKAYHVLGRVADACREVQAELAKHVPPEVLAAAEGEAVAFLRSLL